MSEIRAYARNSDGTLRIISILRDERGRPCANDGKPLWPTDGWAELRGWPDSLVDIWTNDAGVEVLVPRERRR